jgi:hypothetical protein
VTKEELIALKAHTRIKYIGIDPALVARFNTQGPKTALTKGVVLGYVSDYSSYTSYGSAKSRGIVMRTWAAGTFENVVPEDWIIVDDKRKDLVHARERRNVKNTDAFVRRELSKFTDEFRRMKDTKARIDTWLEGVPLADRFKILTTLTEEQKAWLQLVSMDSEEVITAIKKIATDDPVDVPEVPNGSKGPDVLLPPKTIVCSS